MSRFSRKDLFNECELIVRRLCNSGKLTMSQEVPFRSNHTLHYTVNEFDKRITSRRFLFNNPSLRKRYDDEIKNSENLTQRQNISISYTNNFISECFKNSEFVYFPIDKEYDDKNLDDLQYYVKFNKIAYDRLKVYWSQRSFGDTVMCLVRLQREFQTDKHVVFNPEDLFPQIGTYELREGFFVVRNKQKQIAH